MQINVLTGKKYNKLLKSATFGAKQCEFISLIGFKPRNSRWWLIK